MMLSVVVDLEMVLVPKYRCLWLCQYTEETAKKKFMQEVIHTQDKEYTCLNLIIPTAYGAQRLCIIEFITQDEDNLESIFVKDDVVHVDPQ